MLENLETFGVFDGDCDCISTFNVAAFLALGYPARFVAIRTEEDNPEFSHVFCEGFDGEEWRRLDPTVPLAIVDEEIDYARIVEFVG